MRSTAVAGVAAAVTALLGVISAQETTSLFLPYFSPGHPLLASIVDADHTATTYSIACSIYEPSLPNGCRVPIPFYLTSGPTFMHATMSLPSTSETRTRTTTTNYYTPQLHLYLHLFPAYTEDAYCHLYPASASASCLVTATGGALTVPTFTNRKTLVGEGFWGGWREVAFRDVMPMSYAPVLSGGGGGGGGGGKGEGEGGGRVWRRAVVSEIPQTRDDGLVRGEMTVKTPAKTVGAIMPRETGSGGDGGGEWMMTVTAMPGASVGGDAQVVLGGVEAEIGAGEEVHTITKTVVEEVIETKAISGKGS
ncbi:hypothetical protein VE03_02024 [Pseudogymnoascus sp. 23342-1-I1]|nr:hypothetical protein VE03_02024 [Pseudogymnoascus sp. 23342-1-I1]